MRRARILRQALPVLLAASECAPGALERVNEARGLVALRCAARSSRALPQELLHPLLSRLVKQPFFRYFRVNLYGKCPFWCVRAAMCAASARPHTLPHQA